MPLVALASVKSSPGATTVALALAAGWPAQRRLLLEADPSGGDLSLWMSLSAAPGLVGLAAATRHDDPAPPRLHARELADGTHLIAAPPGAAQASACVATLAGTSMLGRLAASDDVVIADCGRLYPGSPAFGVAAVAEVTLLVIRPQVSELAHLQSRVEELGHAGLRLSLVLAPAVRRIPDEPSYPPEEITDTLGIPVHAALPHDPRAVGHLIRGDGSQGRAARRLPLLRAAAGLAADLAAASGPQPGPPDTPPVPGQAPAQEVTVSDRS